MKDYIKSNWRIIVAALAMITGAALLIAGCATKPPTALESKFFNVVTNPPIISVTTNYIPVTLYRTNEIAVTVTNVTGVTETVTNKVTIPVTNYVAVPELVTNVPQTYTFTPGPTANAITNVATGAGNLFGVGGIVGTFVGGLFSLYGLFRSKSNYATAANTAQIVETMREMIKSLPQGAQYDSALVQWMQAHQAEENVLTNAIRIVNREVDNPAARVASQEIVATINALRGTTPIIPTATKTTI